MTSVDDILGPPSVDEVLGPEPKANAKGATGDFTSDALRYIGTGITKGVSGLANVLTSGLAPGAGSYGEVIGEDASGRPVRYEGPGGGIEAKVYERMPEYTPEGGAGRIGLQAISGATQGALGGGIRGALAGGLSGTSQGTVAETTDNPLAIAGAAYLPTAAGYLGYRALPRVDPGVADRAAALIAQGVPVRAAQIVPGGTSGASGDVGQVRAFTRAASHLVGEDTDNFTSQVNERAQNRAAAAMEDAARRTGINGSDPYLLNALSAIERDANLHFPAASTGRNAVQHQINNVLNEMSTGSISGDTYQAFTKKAGPISALQKDPATAEFGNRIRMALDDALQREAAARGDTAAVAQLQQARRTYRHTIMLGPLADDTTGLIDPQKMQAAAERSYPGYRTGTSQAPADVMALAEGGRFLPRPTAQGDVKVPSGAGRTALVNLAKYGGPVGAALAAEHWSELGTMAEHSPGTAATIAGAVGLGLAGRGIYRGAVGSQAYTNLLLGKARGHPGVTLNMLLAPGLLASEVPTE